MTSQTPKYSTIYSKEYDIINHRKDDFAIEASYYFQEFEKTTNYKKKVEVIKGLLELFIKNDDIIFYKYRILEDIKTWSKLKNMILLKCHEFKKKKELKDICNTFLRKYFSCQQKTKKGHMCKYFVHPISDDLFSVMEYMILIEEKEKDFSISLEEIEKLQSFRKNIKLLQYCNVHKNN